MAHVINDDCVCCGACASVCPHNAISDGSPKYIIDPKTCVDCGDCVGACPTGAISKA